MTNTSELVKGFIYNLALMIDKHTEGVTKLLTALATFLAARYMISTNPDDPAIALTLLVLLVMCPIFYLVIFIPVRILKLICHVGLLIFWAWEADCQEDHHEYHQEYRQKYQQEYQHTPYDDALRYFGLSGAFTEAELKTKYRNAMKKAHPDAGGSTEEAEKINFYYTYLKGYAH